MTPGIILFLKLAAMWLFIYLPLAFLEYREQKIWERNHCVTRNHKCKFVLTQPLQLCHTRNQPPCHSKVVSIQLPS